MTSHSFRVILYSELWLTYIAVSLLPIFIARQSRFSQSEPPNLSTSTIVDAEERILFSIDQRLKVNLNFQELETESE